MTTKAETRTAKTDYVIEPGKQEITITRVFDAPRELVFKAFTEANRTDRRARDRPLDKRSTDVYSAK